MQFYKQIIHSTAKVHQYDLFKVVVSKPSVKGVMDSYFRRTPCNEPSVSKMITEM